MKRILKSFIILIILLLSGCGPINLTIRTPSDVQLRLEEFNVGKTPITFNLKCPNVSTYQFIFEKNVLIRVGLSVAEADEVMKSGNVIDIEFHSYSCGENAKLEITNSQIRSILLEGGEATYTWYKSNGGGVYTANMKKRFSK